LAGSVIEVLAISGLSIEDLSPLREMPLRSLTVTAANLSPEQLDFVAGLRYLEHLGEAADPEDQTPEDFLRRVHAGEYVSDQ